eukprot:Blabericola_migrator_1__8152@NODE_4205_length_1281_cov_83_437397_g2543_i1_p1_GENE_NODE_4205_length_1281_cov_83_437397_g2543_i1NODE_4205_length_1281_cov_83_437397_g2543_i1_p1_ORF_typecomplete_len107_score10_59_NODE_4205_length_1281_cov_83_437397_g2543_i144364
MAVTKLAVRGLVKRLDESNARLYGFHVEPTLVGAVLIPKVCSDGEIRSLLTSKHKLFRLLVGQYLPFQRFYLQECPLDVLVECVTCVGTPPCTLRYMLLTSIHSRF